MRTSEPPKLVLRPPAKVAFWALVIVLTVAGSLFLVLNADLRSFAAFSASIKSLLKPLLVALATIALSAGSSLLASRLYTSHEENQYKRTIEKIEDSIGIEPVNTFIRELHAYRSHYSNYEVSVAFRSHASTTSILCLEFTYRYRKRLPQNRLEFEIRRLRVAEDRLAFERQRGELVDIYLSREFFFHLDEESLARLAARNNIDLESCYRVERLRINNEHVDLVRRDGSTLWEATAPQDAMQGPCDIEYRVCLPFEPDSYMTLVLEFPTRGCRFYVDSRAVPGTELAMVDFIGRRHGLVTHYSTNEVEIRQDGWALPKTGVVLVWWTDQAATDTPALLRGNGQDSGDTVPMGNASQTAST